MSGQHIVLDKRSLHGDEPASGLVFLMMNDTTVHNGLGHSRQMGIGRDTKGTAKSDYRSTTGHSFSHHVDSH